MRVLVIDNYDSFTYNLVDALRRLPLNKIQVIANDQLHDHIEDSFDRVLISPGPGTPDEAGQLMSFLDKTHSSKSILGICLGHQALAQLFGARLVNLDKPRHGETVTIQLSEDPLFSGLPKDIKGGLYHSWTVDNSSLPPKIKVIARTDDRIMAIRHVKYDLVGLQFHPESFATEYGLDILHNWLVPALDLS